MFALRPIGRVVSPLTDTADAPLQGNEGAPPARILFEEDVRDAVRDLRPGDEVFVLTWLHRASRDVLRVHPRDDPGRPVRGVFGTRSPDRPNPIGLHRAEVVAVDGPRVQVSELETIDGTPVIDVEPVVSADGR